MVNFSDFFDTIPTDDPKVVQYRCKHCGAILPDISVALAKHAAKHAGIKLYILPPHLAN